VHAELDTGSYPTGIKVSDTELAALKPRIKPDRFHGDWVRHEAPSDRAEV
jgi:hypothetical protein